MRHLMTKENRLNARNGMISAILKREPDAVKVEDGDLVILLRSKCCVMGWTGTSAHPAFNYRFSSEARRLEYVNNYREKHRQALARKAARRPKRLTKVSAIYEKALKTSREKEYAYVDCAEMACLIRAGLKQKFPGIRFSVRSDTYSGGASIRVSWVDGPTDKAVSSFLHQFEGSGFDGMIDLKYGKSIWLAPDGSVSFAHTGGTTGSAGTCPEQIGSPHHPNAVLIHPACDYVFANRDMSPQADEILLAWAKGRIAAGDQWSTDCPHQLARQLFAETNYPKGATVREIRHRDDFTCGAADNPSSAWEIVLTV